MKLKHNAAVVLAITGLSCVSEAPVILAQTPALRPPSVPLITHDPYFSLWSNSDRLTDSSTTHWTGRAQALSSLVRIDGKAFRLMGESPKTASVLPQTSVEVLPTRTIYTFAGEGVKVKLVFTSPLLPAELDLLSRPLSYVSWEIVSTDGKNHTASIYLDASSALTVNNANQKVVWNRQKAGPLTALRMGSEAQQVLQKTGDDLRIDWGYSYLAADAKQATFSLGDNDSLESTFAALGSLPHQDDTRQPRAVDDGEPVAALMFSLGNVGAQPVTRYAMLAYDDIQSIQFLGSNLRPYWRRNGANADTLLQEGARNYAAILKRCEAFDAELMTDLTTIGGAKYAQLTALAHRQALAAQKLVADANGQPLSFSKENNSNGCIATVDLMYPAAPQMAALSPSLLRATLQPIMLYGASPLWKWPFAPHDIGTYPKANGQVYGGGERTEENQMPVEESGNLILMLGALSKIEGNTKYADQFWPTITKWAEYLADKGFDPESQLSTDDFAGHLAHNVNLSGKAIVALGAYAQMAQMRGDTAASTKYRSLAEKFAGQWMEAAADGGRTKLAFDKPGTWSQKYNLVWDGILSLNLFPQSLYTREMTFYKTKLNAYGLPLDSRRDYTKLDWEIWTATLTGKREDLETIVNPIYSWLNSTTSRVPLTDWYDTKDGKQQNFKARSVVGGIFIPMLKDNAIWTKWSTRDKGRYTNWAPLPIRPEYREVVPTGDTQTGIYWKYSLEEPGGEWFATNYDDSRWNTGEAGFGTGGTPAIKIRSDWKSKDIWMRRTFNFTGNPAAKFQLYGFHDDTVDIYLNGRLVATLNGYNASYEALAEIPAGLLKTGGNLLAVHCHQDAGGQGIDIGISEQVKKAAPR